MIGSGGQSAAHGQLEGPSRVRGAAAGRIQAAPNGCFTGELHPGQVRAEEVRGQGVGAIASAKGN